MSASSLPSLGVSQNTLRDPRLVASLIDRSSIVGEDLVVEIGPGKGIITAQLARRCKRVIAIEKDPALSAILRERFAREPNLVLRNGDFLSYPLPRGPYKVFANIPFHITSAIVARLTAAANPPEEACLVMQKEAALVYLGRPRASLRSILLYPWFELEIIHQFHSSDFTPQPRVAAVLLKIMKRNPPLVGRSDRRRFGDFVVYGFTAWQPTLGEAFKGVFTCRQMKQIGREAGIDLQSTPTDLEPEKWLRLFEIYKRIASPQAAALVCGSEARLQRQQSKLQKVHRTRTR